MYVLWDTHLRKPANAGDVQALLDTVIVYFWRKDNSLRPEIVLTPEQQQLMLEVENVTPDTPGQPLYFMVHDALGDLNDTQRKVFWDVCAL